MLWTLFNFALVIFFLVICIRAVKLVREKTGTFAAFLFVVGLFAFVRKQDEEIGPLVAKRNDSTHFLPIRNSVSIQPNADYIKHTVADYVGTDLNMEVSYSKGTDDIPTQVREVSFLFEGFVGGHNWKPMSVEITLSNTKEALDYDIDGILRWNLLGINIYSQAKHFTGSVYLR